jgi:hypothetical protein
LCALQLENWTTVVDLIITITPNQGLGRSEGALQLSLRGDDDGHDGELYGMGLGAQAANGTSHGNGNHTKLSVSLVLISSHNQNCSH